MKHIGELIAEKLGKEKGRQKRLADACGVSTQAITGWIKTGHVSKEHYPVISQMLGIPLSALHQVGKSSKITQNGLNLPDMGDLPYEDRDIYEIAEMWPYLPENIKNHIRDTIRVYLESMEPQLMEYLKNASRNAQKKFNAYMEHRNIARDPAKKPKS